MIPLVLRSEGHINVMALILEDKTLLRYEEHSVENQEYKEGYTWS